MTVSYMYDSKYLVPNAQSSLILQAAPSAIKVHFLLTHIPNLQLVSFSQVSPTDLLCLKKGKEMK